MTVLTYRDSRDCDVEVFTFTLNTTGAIYVDYPEDLRESFLRAFSVGFFNVNQIRCIVFTRNKVFAELVAKLAGADGSASFNLEGVGEVYYVYSTFDAHNFYLQFNPEQREIWKFKLDGMWPKSL